MRPGDGNASDGNGGSDAVIRISQIKLPVTHGPEELEKKAAKLLRLRPQEIVSLTIVRRSLDARKRGGLSYIYCVDVAVRGAEETVLRRAKSPEIARAPRETYRLPAPGGEPLGVRPLIAGFGPAGMFCALMLARAGYRPLILERGADVDTRAAIVKRFWDGGPLDPECNVQFGEGGAGTFSDGKLNTLVRDPSGRNREVLRIFAEAGADPAITYVAKPHVGTDALRRVVKNIREEILRLGGEIRFGWKLADLELEGGTLRAVLAEHGAGRERIPAQALVLAIGHSARDTFVMLQDRRLNLEPKAFAVGLRIQHPQAQINRIQYGMEDPGALGAASYKLTARTGSGRGVYSFCMCPGGFVVNASSEAGRLAVNGMSNHDRGGKNANSALIVTVTPEDFPEPGALGGVAFQRRLEEAAWQLGGGKIPVQLYGDFKTGRVSGSLGRVAPAFEGGWAFANLRELLPKELSQAFLEGMDQFGRVMEGFDRADALLAGVESRTSSPVRIPRGEKLESAAGGIYPCGEGAGYAGGIMSAAMDGMKTAEALIARFRPEY